MATCNPDQLITDGKCFSLSCLTPDQQRIARLQLLCEIKEALSGGGGGGVTSIIAGTGISVDQATGDVTVTATGGGGGTVDIYWIDLSNSSPVSIDLAALGAGAHDITGDLPGWTGVETAALLAAIQDGKQVSFTFSAETAISNSGVVGFDSVSSVQLGGTDDGSNAPPFCQISNFVTKLAISDSVVDCTASITVDYGTVKAAFTAGVQNNSPNPDGTVNSAGVFPGGPSQVNGSYSAIYDGKIYANRIQQTNCTANTLSIYTFKITILNP